MVRIRRSAILCILVGALGCGAVDRTDDSGAELAVSVDTIAGIEHVLASGSPPAWALDTILELGVLGKPSGEPADDEFAWVSSVTLGPDGNLYVADHGNNEIRVFDRAGVLRRTIGRKGQGPGEFSSIFSIQWLGDTLMAVDPSNARVGLFSKAGEWLSSRPAPGPLVVTPSPSASTASAPGKSTNGLTETETVIWRPRGAVTALPEAAMNGHASRFP